MVVVSNDIRPGANVTPLKQRGLRNSERNVLLSSSLYFVELEHKLLAPQNAKSSDSRGVTKA